MASLPTSVRELMLETISIHPSPTAVQVEAPLKQVDRADHWISTSNLSPLLLSSEQLADFDDLVIFKASFFRIFG